MSDKFAEFEAIMAAIRGHPAADVLGTDGWTMQEDIHYTYKDFDAFLPSLTGVHLPDAYKQRVLTLLTPTIADRLKRQCDSEPTEGQTVAGGIVHWMQETIDMFENVFGTDLLKTSPKWMRGARADVILRHVAENPLIVSEVNKNPGMTKPGFHAHGFVDDIERGQAAKPDTFIGLFFSRNAAGGYDLHLWLVGPGVCRSSILYDCFGKGLSTLVVAMGALAHPELAEQGFASYRCPFSDIRYNGQYRTTQAYKLVNGKTVVFRGAYPPCGSAEKAPCVLGSLSCDMTDGNVAWFWTNASGKSKKLSCDHMRVRGCIVYLPSVTAALSDQWWKDHKMKRPATLKTRVTKRAEQFLNHYLPK